MSRFAALRRPLVCLPLGCLALFAGTLASAPKTIVSQPEAVWVYFTSVCAKPRDASDCRPVQVPVRPHFSSAEACSAHRDADLDQKADPRLMGSCLRQLEA